MKLFLTRYGFMIASILLLLSLILITRAHGEAVAPDLKPEFRDAKYDIAYLVEPGDTLAQIAQFYFGDWKKWEYLANLNGLEVVWKDGDPYVFLKIGQVLEIAKKKMLSPNEVAEYFEATRKWMNEKVFTIAAIPERARYPKDNTEQIVIGFINERASVRVLKRWITWLDHQNRYRLVDEIYDGVLANIGSLPFQKSPQYWEDHRIMCILLMTILDAESDGKAVRGPHGEAGEWQVMPSTYLQYKGFTTKECRDPEWQEIAAEILMDDSNEALNVVVLPRLCEKSNILDALSHYNGYGDAAKAYGWRVYRKYQANLKKFGV